MFKNIRFYWIYLFCLSAYIGLSYKIFKKIDSLPGLFVDELFHVPQGLLFCNGNFSYYDPKITTPPGLYLLSTLVLSPFQLCSTYWLRFFNFVLGIINIELVRRLCTYNDRPPNLTTLQCKIFEMISAFVICSLPPLYFFNNLYYTDTISTTSVLCMFLAAKNNYHYTFIFFGAVSIVIRQTNIIWLSVVYGETLITLLLQVFLTPYREERITRTRFRFFPDVKDALIRLRYHRFPYYLIKTYEIFTCAFYIGLIHIFITFVYYNGGIVLGDKNSHKPTIHIPQLMYFALFALSFSWSHYLNEIKPFMIAILNNKRRFLIYLSGFLFFVAINSHVHPYLLADNRHFTFYIWNRILSHTVYRYSLILVYMFAWYAIYKKLFKMSSFQFIFVFTCGTFLTLAFQKLIDLRYFFLPYIALRIRTNTYNKYILGFELLTTLIVNLLSLKVFFSREFQWENFDYPQRIGW